MSDLALSHEFNSSKAAPGCSGIGREGGSEKSCIATIFFPLSNLQERGERERDLEITEVFWGKGAGELRSCISACVQLLLNKRNIIREEGGEGKLAPLSPLL